MASDGHGVSPIWEEIVALATKDKKIKADQDRVVQVMFKTYSDFKHQGALIEGFIEYKVKAILTKRREVVTKELFQFFVHPFAMSCGSAGLPSNCAFLSIKSASVYKCLLQAEAISKWRHEMEALATNASTDTKHQELGALIADWQNACKEVASETRDLFAKLHDELTARKEVLKNELKNLYLLNHSILLDQLKRLSEIEASLKSTISGSVSDIQSLSHADLFVVRSNIKSELEKIERQCIVLESDAECVIDFNVDLEYLLCCLENLDGYELVSVIKNMGAVINKSTCAATTSAAGFGLQCAPLGNEASFTITTYDAQGFRRGKGNDVFVVELKEPMGERKVGANLENKGDGTYVATYTVPVDAKPGDYTLSVLLRGAHIQDSPFIVRVGHPP